MEYIQADIWGGSSACRARSAFHRRRRRSRRADHAGGGEGGDCRLSNSSRKSPRGASNYLDGFNIEFDNWHSTHSKENTELSQDIYRKLDKAGLVYQKAVEQFFDPVKGHVSRRSLHQGRVPELRREGSVRRRVRKLRYRLLADEAQKSVLDPVRAKPVLKSSEHYFFRLSDPKCTASCAKWINKSDRLQPQVANKAKNGSKAKATRR